MVAVEPIVLEGALAAVLAESDRAEVVQFHEATSEELAAHYEAAIVTVGLARDLRPEILITLPDTVAGSCVAQVTVGEVSRDVAVRRGEEVIDLLAEQFSVEIPNIYRFTSLSESAPDQK